MSTSPKGLVGRIQSLDQFRGYTVLGMLFVNFLGGYLVVPAVFKHHNTYCSYADTIMPQFFFAVGFAYRLTFLKRLRTVGTAGAVGAVLNRALGLALIGFVVYHLDGDYKKWTDLQRLGPWGVISAAFRREFFQTLVHIAITSVWILPVIALGARARVLYMIASGALHFGLSWWFYKDWALHAPVIDGGPLGFLSWSIPTLVGSLAYDAVVRGPYPWSSVGRLVAWSIGLAAIGYGLSCLGGAWAEPPFFPPADGNITLYTMSQRTGAISYLTFSAGFSILVYAVFVVACDRFGLSIGVFRVFGVNALAAYLIHGMVAGAVKPFLPNDSPLWYLAIGVTVYLGICYVFNRSLEKHQIFLKL